MELAIFKINATIYPEIVTYSRLKRIKSGLLGVYVVNKC